MKSMPKRCPNCKNDDLRLYSHDPLFLNQHNETEVVCGNCGIIGTVMARVLPLKDSFELVDDKT